MLTLGQLLLLALIVIVVWLVGKVKKHEDRIGSLENGEEKGES